MEFGERDCPSGEPLLDLGAPGGSDSTVVVWSTVPMSNPLPVFSLSQDGGPWPWMMDLQPGVWDRLHASLQVLPHLVGVVCSSDQLAPTVGARA